MAAPSQFVISRPVMVLTDYLEGTGYSSSIGLAFQAGSLSATLASGSPTTVRGVSMSLPNLQYMVDNMPATPGQAPFFSLPLKEPPEFTSTSRGWSLSLNAVIDALLWLLPDGIGGSVDVRIETDAQRVTHIRVDGPQLKQKLGVTITLVDGLEIGRTRVDDAGQAWLDLRFLSLFSSVTDGHSLLTWAFGAPGNGSFSLSLDDLPISFDGSSVLKLKANVVLDNLPNFAPRLDLGSSATHRDYSAQASQPFKFGQNFFFGADFQASVSAVLPGGLDLVDPIENPTASASIPSTTYNLWSPPDSGFRPVLMARPLTGTVQIDGVSVNFPSDDAVTVKNIDSITDRTAAGAGTDEFIRFGADVYRALTLSELAGLQFTGTAQQALQHPETDISFLIRDAQGALSTEYVARMHLQTARVSGSVSHWVGGEPLQGVRVALARDSGSGATESAVVNSAPDGKWQIEGLDFTRFAATAQRAAETADVGRAVGAADVLAALKLATGRSHTAAATVGSSSDPAAIRQAAIAKLAADFNGDGQLEVEDAASILRVVTGQTTAGSLGWRFFALDQAVELADVVQVDATAASRLDWLGFLIGDVDGSWHPAANG